MRHTPAQVIAALETGGDHRKQPQTPRRSVERLTDLVSVHDAEDESWQRALDSLENGISNLVEGRSKVYEAIVKGEVPEDPGLPESFNVLVRELQSLCLDVELLKT